MCGDTVCGDKVCVDKCVVTKCGGGRRRGRRRRSPGYRIKNKNPTQRCGEKMMVKTHGFPCRFSGENQSIEKQDGLGYHPNGGLALMLTLRHEV